MVKLLHEYANKIEKGNSNITVEEASNILSAIAHIAMTKEEVCEFLNISRSRFDDLVREGVIPRGKKLIILEVVFLMKNIWLNISKIRWMTLMA